MPKEDFFILQLQKFTLILKKLLDPTLVLEDIKTELDQIQLNGELMVNFISKNVMSSEILNYLGTLNAELFKKLIEFQFHQAKFQNKNDTFKLDNELKKLELLHSIYKDKHHLFDVQIHTFLEQNKK